jgi:hypothetical protein
MGYRDIWEAGMGYAGDAGEMEMGEDYGEVEDLVGAVTTAQAQQVRRNVAAPQQGTRMVRRPLTQLQELNLPLSKLAIGASVSDSVQATPAKIFRVKRFTVADSIAAFFTISGLFVGTDSQFVSLGGITSAESFSSKGVGVSLKGGTARPGVFVTVQFTNLDTVSAHNFLSNVIGDAALA